MNKRVAPSVELEAAIEQLLTEGLTDSERLAEIGRLGARLAIQGAIEEEVDAFLGRTRYERTPEARGWRNGNRPKRMQTAEGELEIQMPQIRGAAEKFVSSVIPNGRTALRTRPLEALIIGAWVWGLSDRDIESLVEAGLCSCDDCGGHLVDGGACRAGAATRSASPRVSIVTAAWCGSRCTRPAAASTLTPCVLRKNRSASARRAGAGRPRSLATRAAEGQRRRPGRRDPASALAAAAVSPAGSRPAVVVWRDTGTAPR